jgi:hypothetical protein
MASPLTSSPRAWTRHADGSTRSPVSLHEPVCACAMCDRLSQPCSVKYPHAHACVCAPAHHCVQELRRMCTLSGCV